MFTFVPTGQSAARTPCVMGCPLQSHVLVIAPSCLTDDCLTALHAAGPLYSCYAPAGHQATILPHPFALLPLAALPTKPGTFPQAVAACGPRSSRYCLYWLGRFLTGHCLGRRRLLMYSQRRGVARLLAARLPEQLAAVARPHVSAAQCASVAAAAGVGVLP